MDRLTEFRSPARSLLPLPMPSGLTPHGRQDPRHPGRSFSMLVMGGRGRRAGDHAIRFSVWKPDGSSSEDANAR